MQLEFITEHKIANLNIEDFFSLIIDRILDNRILIVEKELTASERIRSQIDNYVIDSPSYTGY